MTQKLEITKQEDNSSEMYAGQATRQDGHTFSFNIYQQTSYLWNTEYCITSEGQIIEKSIKYTDTMLNAFVWASEFYRDWRPEGY